MDFSTLTSAATWSNFGLWFFGTYLYLAFGITGGYHRLLTHKGYKVPALLKYFIVSGGYFALMGAPISWVATHRLHHQKSDQPGDPHSPRDGFEHALYKWMFSMEAKQPVEEIRKQVPDLLEDKVLCLLGTDHSAGQAQLCLAVNVVARILILAFFGPVAFTANLIASIMVFWSPQFVNTYCHLNNWGYRNFEIRDDSRNVAWVGIMALGEGWHNNHHAFPKSARHGMKWWEIDVTWMLIWTMEKLGLAKEVVRPNVTATAVAARAAVASKVKGSEPAQVVIKQATTESAEILKETEEPELVEAK